MEFPRFVVAVMGGFCRIGGKSGKGEAGEKTDDKGYLKGYKAGFAEGLKMQLSFSNEKS